MCWRCGEVAEEEERSDAQKYEQASFTHATSTLLPKPFVFGGVESTFLDIEQLAFTNYGHQLGQR